MKIQNINTNNYNNTKQNNRKIGFKSMSNLNHIKYIPDVPCACCGKPMINGGQASDIWRKITKPISYIMSRNLFERWQEYPEIYNTIAELSNKYPDDSLDNITCQDENFLQLKRSVVNSVRNYNIDDNNGSERLIARSSKKIYNLVLKTSRIDLKNVGTFMRYYKPYKKYLTGVQLETFNEMQKYAEKDPYTTLSRLVHSKEIYDDHYQEYINEHEQKLAEIENIFGNINAIINKLNIPDKTVAENLQTKSTDILYNTKDCFLRNYKIKELYSNTLSQYTSKDIINEINNHINNLPDLGFTMHNFFSFSAGHRLSDYTIASAFINPISACTLNILPSNEVNYGYANRYNKAVLCCECHDKLVGNNFSDYINANPNALENTMNQIRTIQKYTTGQEPENFPTELLRYPQKLTEFLLQGYRNKNRPDGTEIDYNI